MRVTRAEIDLKALQHNYSEIRKKVGISVMIMGVVKANAYGHGIVEISKALAGYGAEYLGVGFLEEGILLREQGVATPILVLGGVVGRQIRDFLKYDLDITVASLEIAQRISSETRSYGRKASVHLKIDTGMERIGVSAENAVGFAEQVCRMQGLNVLGIYSHFATADERSKEFSFGQLHKFQKVIDSLRAKNIEIPLIHVANSGAVLDIPESYFSMVRPGMMMYGIYPSEETSESIPIRPVLSLKSNIVYLKEVPASTSVSYGRKYFTSSKTKIATVPIGYGDGYSRMLTNKSSVLIRGKKHPVVGTICMDQLMVDVGYETPVHVGDEVTLIGTDNGSSITAWDVARLLGTIPYEVCTNIAARVPRLISQ